MYFLQQILTPKGPITCPNNALTQKQVFKYMNLWRILSIQNIIFSILFYFMYKTADFMLKMNQILLPLVNYMNIVDRTSIPSRNKFSNTFKKLQLWLNSEKSKTSLKQHSTNVLEVSKEIAGYVGASANNPNSYYAPVGDCRFQVSLRYRMGPWMKNTRGGEISQSKFTYLA